MKRESTRTTALLMMLAMVGTLAACGDDEAASTGGTGGQGASSPSGGQGNAGAGGTGGTGGSGGSGGSGGTGGEADPVSLAHDFFWQAFTGEDHASAAEATELLEAAADAAPDDPGNTLRLAHSYLWRLAEIEKVPGASPGDVPALAGNAEALFALAQQQAPGDNRIGGWLGPMMVGAGSFTGDQEKVAAGLAMIDEGVAAYPEFYLFIRAMVHSLDPKDSPAFEQSIEDLWTTIELCTGGPVDRENPDFSGLLEGESDPACGNPPKAGHNLEGFMLFFGDMLTKAGEPDQAQAVYELTQQTPDYGVWPYAPVLEQRIADLPERAALFANEDPSDDPEIIAASSSQCAYCHAQSPSEALPQSR